MHMLKRQASDLRVHRQGRDTKVAVSLLLAFTCDVYHGQCRLFCTGAAASVLSPFAHIVYWATLFSLSLLSACHGIAVANVRAWTRIVPLSFPCLLALPQVLRGMHCSAFGFVLVAIHVTHLFCLWPSFGRWCAFLRLCLLGAFTFCLVSLSLPLH